MRKIPTLFIRSDNHGLVTDVVNPDCAWVLNGEGFATRKFDGTCTMLDGDGIWWARREIKPGQEIPDNFVHVNTDEFTGKIMGWIPMEDSSFVKWFNDVKDKPILSGTYELCGPKIQSDPDGFGEHVLIPHGKNIVEAERTYEGIKNWIMANPFEGLVFWYDEQGTKMAKIKKKDYPKEKK